MIIIGFIYLAYRRANRFVISMIAVMGEKIIQGIISVALRSGSVFAACRSCIVQQL